MRLVFPQTADDTTVSGQDKARNSGLPRGVGHLFAMSDTAHPRIKCLTNEPAPLKKVRSDLGHFNGEPHTTAPDQLKVVLRRVIPEYTPALSDKKLNSGQRGTNTPEMLKF